MDYIIRSMTLADVQAVCEIESLSFASPWTEASFINELTNNKLAHYYVAEVSGRVVAYLGVWYILDEGHITNIAVKPAYRGNGYGLALVYHLKSVAPESGIAWLTLEVRVSNVPAIALYEKMGFETQGIRKKYYQDNGEDAMIMWCSLVEGAVRE
ncbi:MAG: ribosomal protein S18-alanine N-acetyltransferase [Clostridia bacterium]|nr:ribosomal protein S18-alanine N-acetyltransferase [Clostridia bacterium]